MMVCKRCGTRCNIRDNGLCFHCTLGMDLDKATSGKVTDGTIKEGFPDWERPRKGDK